MASTKTATTLRSACARVKNSTGAKSGAGACTRLYVGNYGGYQYKSYMDFAALDPTDTFWNNVGQIKSAVLTVFADAGGGILGNTMKTGSPKVSFKRATDSFGEHNESPSFTTGDYTVAAAAATPTKTIEPTRTGHARVDIDVTAFLENWAPTRVKRRDGGNCYARAGYGFVLKGNTSTADNWAIYSEDSSLTQYHPYVTLTYEQALTTPATPTSLTPSGAINRPLTSFHGHFSDADSRDKLARSQVQVYGTNSTTPTPIYDKTLTCTAAEVAAGEFSHVPLALVLKSSTTYYWRAKVWDSDGSPSSWTALTAFSLNNASPNAPTTLMPASGSSYASLANVTFGATFSDSDATDTMKAWEIQMSAYGSGDAHWLDDEFILWSTGKQTSFISGGAFKTQYTGPTLAAGTYYWRVRMWDNYSAVGAWAYATLIVSAAFVPEPNDSENLIQLRPRAPWRIVIRAMGARRGPGAIVAILEDAKNVGASLMYNSPGEAHWTLGVNHPQIGLIDPKLTHYAIEFAQGEGWREAYSGLVWDIDANDNDVIFYGIDYLALLDRVIDTRYDSTNLEKAYPVGSKYTSKDIKTIVADQLSQAYAKTNSPVGFITTSAADIATMAEVVTLYSTYQPTLNFVVGLLDSHRSGTAKNTRLSVQKTTTGGYKWVVQDNPGVLRSNLRLKYGELVQGYRIQPYGDDWATRVAAIGRDKDGVLVRYYNENAAALPEATWGRFDYPTFIDGLEDENDLKRRTKQMVTSLSSLGKKMGIGLRSGVLQPRDGYDLMDRFIVDIEHAAIDTTNFGHDGEWVCYGITWQGLERGDSNTTLTLLPKESGSSPSADLLVSQPMSTQREWQVGYTAPNPLTVTARFWLDRNTGKVYSRVVGNLIATGITGVAP